MAGISNITSSGGVMGPRGVAVNDGVDRLELSNCGGVMLGGEGVL